MKLRKDRPGFTVKKVGDKTGKGVFTRRAFKKGEFLLEYDGELITKKEALKREKEYPVHLRSFMYFFTANDSRLCVDATFSKRKGRYANDEPAQSANAEMKLQFLENTPFLCLYAKRHISKGEEIRYDYGIKDLPGRQDIRKRNTKKNKLPKCKAIKQVKRIPEQRNTRNKATKWKAITQVKQIPELEVKSTTNKTNNHYGVKTCCVALHQLSLSGTDISLDKGETSIAPQPSISSKSLTSVSRASEVHHKSSNGSNERKTRQQKVGDTSCTSTSVDTLVTEAENVQGSSAEKTGQTSRTKPHRPCMFCKKFQSKLSLHIRTIHTNEAKVKYAMSLPRALRDKEFDGMRKEGILMINRQKMLGKDVKSNPIDYVKERRHTNATTVMCSSCFGFYSSSTIFNTNAIVIHMNL